MINSKQEMEEINEPDSISEPGNGQHSTKDLLDIKEKQEIDENVLFSVSEEARDIGHEKNGSMSWEEGFGSLGGINKKEMGEKVSESAPNLGQRKVGSMSCEEGFGSIEVQKYKVDNEPASIYEDVKKMSNMIKEIQDMDGTEIGFIVEAQNDENIDFKICDESVEDSYEIDKNLKITEEINFGRCQESLGTFSEINEKSQPAEIEQIISTLEIKEMQETLRNNVEKMNGFNAFEKLVKSSSESSAKQEVTEIFLAPTPKPECNGGLKEKGFICCKESSKGSLNTKTKQDKVEKEKCSSKRGKDVKNGSETNGLTFISEARNVSKRSYLRSQMEALRFVDEEEQKKRWNEIYQGLGSVVTQEFNEIAVAKHQQKQGHRNVDRRQRQRMAKKKETLTILGVEAAKERRKHLQICVQ